LSSRIGIANASLVAGLLVAMGALLVIPFPLTRAKGQDFSPANRPAPTKPADAPAGDGPLELAYEYRIPADKSAAFVDLMHHGLKPQRLRNGAAHWRLEKRGEENGSAVFEESFAFAS